MTWHHKDKGLHQVRFFLRCSFSYMDDLRSVVPATVKAAPFADVVSLISSHHNKLVAEEELQRAVNAVAESLPTTPAFITTSSRNSSESHWTSC